MKIEIVRKTKKRIERAFVEKIVKKTRAASGKRAGNFSVSVVFAGKEEIRRLNRKYRKKNKATDVLSFDYSLGYNIRGSKNITGEVILCPEIIEKSAKEHEISFREELAFVLSHGILHLLGFRHGKKMYGIQEKISN